MEDNKQTAGQLCQASSWHPSILRCAHVKDSWKVQLQVGIIQSHRSCNAKRHYYICAALSTKAAEPLKLKGLEGWINIARAVNAIYLPRLPPQAAHLPGQHHFKKCDMKAAQTVAEKEHVGIASPSHTTLVAAGLLFVEAPSHGLLPPCSSMALLHELWALHERLAMETLQNKGP